MYLSPSLSFSHSPVYKTLSKFGVEDEPTPLQEALNDLTIIAEVDKNSLPPGADPGEDTEEAQWCRLAWDSCLNSSDTLDGGSADSPDSQQSS